LYRVVATLLASGAMVLVILAITGTLQTGVIAMGRTGKIDRLSAPFTFWLIIVASVGIVALCGARLIRGPLH
jgi:hypothetical protein